MSFSRQLFLMFAALAAGLQQARAELRYTPVSGVNGFTVDYTKVINLHAANGVVSPKFDDVLITHLSFRITPHDSMPLTWKLEVQERGGAWINRIHAPGAIIDAAAFTGRAGSLTTFRSIGTTLARSELLCGISFMHGAMRCYGWVHLRVEYTHPTQPPLTLLAYAWQDDGSAVRAGHFPVERVPLMFDPRGSGKLTWLSSANQSYQLERGASLLDWQPLGSPVSGTGYRQEISLGNPAAPSFFRLKILTAP